jgi:hypothetical protein
MCTHFLMTAATTALLAAVSTPAQAAVKIWLGSFVGDWTSITHLNPAGEPTAADDAVINTGGTALVGASGAAAEASPSVNPGKRDSGHNRRGTAHHDRELQGHRLRSANVKLLLPPAGPGGLSLR